MTVIRVRGFKIFKDRHGRMRCYHRKTNTAIDLDKNSIGSAGFMAECSRVTALYMEERPRAGTWGILASEYKKSPEFMDLADSTRGDYEDVLEYLRPMAQVALSDFKRSLVVRIRDKAFKKHKRRFANYVKQVISLVFSWGEERGYVDHNPAKGIKNIKRPKGMDRANRPWTDEERFAVLDESPWHIKVPVALCMYLALTETDALKLPKGDYKGDVITGKRGKTGVEYTWYVPKPLKKILDAAPIHRATTIAANSNGIPWTAGGFRASWRTFKMGLEKSGKISTGLTIHGLRHTMGHLLTEEGKSRAEVRAALQQKTEAAAAIYSNDVNMKQVMKGNAKTVDMAEARRRRMSNLKRKVSNPS